MNGLRALALIALALAPAGCRKSMAPGCRTLCTCSPCTDTDLDACLDKAEKAQDAAETKGCTEVFETFVGCFEDTARCRGTSAASTDDCALAERNLRACADAGNPFATTCDEAQIKLASCFPGQTPVLGTACSGQTECSSACVLAASCEAIIGQVFDQTFNDCQNRCFGISKGPPPPSPSPPSSP